MIIFLNVERERESYAKLTTLAFSYNDVFPP